MNLRPLSLMALASLALCNLSSACAATPREIASGPERADALPAIDGQFTAEQTWMAETIERIRNQTLVLSERELVEVFVRTMLGPAADNSASADDDSDADWVIEGIIVMDHDPAAFFERAPSKLARRMRLSIQTACKSDTAASIFCEDIHIWFLREVSELGNKTGEGYACTGVYARNQYFSPFSIYRNSGCIPLNCRKGETLCFVSREALLAASHQYSPTKPMKNDWLR